jgi:regulator of protease activity HflC (stomatin/prohibitin superfamily)
MDARELYREEVLTDRKVGTIRVLYPVNPDGTPDPGRETVYAGEAQMYTAMGTLPLSFDIEARSVGEAVAGYAAAATAAVERTVRELEEYRRQAASSIVIPRGSPGGLGPGALGGMPGGGKIQIP